MYLDTAASTPISQNVKDRLLEVLDIYGNPSSIHSEGVNAKKIINSATEDIANIMHCKTSEINYTSGATMSNNLAIQGFMKANPNGVLLYSAIEHNDIIMLAEDVDYTCVSIPVDYTGKIIYNKFVELLNLYEDFKVLVSIQMANSEIGTIQDMKSIVKLVKSYPMTWIHTDATQYIPYYQIDIKELNVDMLSMSGQKIHCIKGIGLLYVKENTPISPIIYGEQGLVGGTENVIGIACLAQAFIDLEYHNYELEDRRNYLYILLKPYGKLVGSLENRLPNNLTMYFPIGGEEMVIFLNENNIQTSTGSACSSQSVEPSHVLVACGYSEDIAKSCVRFTISEDITYDQLEYVADCVKTILHFLED